MESQNIINIPYSIKENKRDKKGKGKVTPKQTYVALRGPGG
jgi:hypothetical protein